MATVRNAKPVTRSKAHEVVYKAQDAGIAITGAHSMGPLLDYDLWENSTPRKGIRHYRLRVYIPDIMYNPQPIQQKQLDLFDTVSNAITKIAQEMLSPDNYRIIKHYETTIFRPTISLIVYYQSYSS
jgi:hypothetical protein